MTGRRVVITGIGLVTALGEGARETWDALVAGRTGIGPLRAYDPAPLRTRLGAEIPDFDPGKYLSLRSMRTSTRGDQYGVAAATLALRDAGLERSDLGHRTGLYLGGNKDICQRDDSIADMEAIRGADGEPDMRKLGELARSIVPPLAYVEGLQNGGTYHISSLFGLRGPNAFYAGAADSGATAIGRAMRAIRRGEADIAVAGGYDDATNWWAMAKLDGLGVLSPRNDLDTKAFRPFDREHSGSVIGDGAAILVLEDRERAVGRGAHIYAELAGYGMGNDCVRPPASDPEGRGLARAISAALSDAGATGTDCVFSHGCATALGDTSEVRALRSALGPETARAAVTSVKPQTGHLVGGAGALNAALAALALDSGVVPATANHETPAPECDLDIVTGAARHARPGVALALARGLEGQAVALALTQSN
ncbi:beta-ketoacyl-[acyl-carrier-protein] synthase family protein [Nocardia tengchongensis]|uniref:beta-ketoacyl-[acyl-carrier-protein] synthase family protein n=1 Tax=Nocardia tengchongensis TaxID=2055889 RepID=UPI0036ADC994